MERYKGVVISLYDYSTEFVKPWAEAGYLCYCIDIQHEEGLTLDNNIIKVGMDVRDIQEWWKSVEADLEVCFLSAFPPCTDLAVSGAAHFKSKELANASYRQEAMELVYIARDFGETLNCPYFIENPVSVISTQWRRPDYIIQPYEYGGYLPEEDRHPTYPDYINSRDAYPKKTCLWTNELFKLPLKKEVNVPSGYSKQHRLLGGKSLKTKNIRSATPRGFSIAVFLAHTTAN